MNETTEELQHQVLKQRLTNIKELESKCEPLGIDPYEDVLFPIGYNTCDRCGAIRDSEVGLIWTDWLPESEYEADQELYDKLDGDYCAICDQCVKELRGKE